jgi:RHS repeat-associated protein
VTFVRPSKKYADQETGFVYFGYRYYSPQDGRWISRDPIAPNDGINLYAYVVNRPIDFTNPDGLQHRDWKKVHHHDYIKDSPNWYFATGQMDHTFHHIALCIKRFDLERAVEMIYDDLTNFAHFSEPTENIAKVKISGDTAHFDLVPSLTASASYLAGNSIDVILAKYPERRELMAMTVGDHPLVGVRKWTVKKVILKAFKSNRVDIVTEAYEQANSRANEAARSFIGRDQQNAMWSTYLENIAEFWSNTYGASEIEVDDPAMVEPAGTTVNPFRSQLPINLQSSRFHDYDEIIPY